MSRRARLIVETEAPLEPKRWYTVRVMGLEVTKREKYMTVSLTHVDGDHQGRCHVVQLQLPVRPYGLAAEFLRACGFEVAAHAELEPEDAVGRLIAVQFDPVAQGGGAVSSFKRLDAEINR